MLHFVRCQDCSQEGWGRNYCGRIASMNQNKLVNLELEKQQSGTKRHEVPHKNGDRVNERIT